ncbi:hypothetical protein HY256_09060 [Candidatus Sumerlaeota bacterium]|nr:hypothetical protein [Candidatus Sumerlaeota bacterium]
MTGEEKARGFGGGSPHHRGRMREAKVTGGAAPGSDGLKMVGPEPKKSSVSIPEPAHRIEAASSSTALPPDHSAGGTGTPTMIILGPGAAEDAKKLKTSARVEVVSTSEVIVGGSPEADAVSEKIVAANAREEKKPASTLTTESGAAAAGEQKAARESAPWIPDKVLETVEGTLASHSGGRKPRLAVLEFPDLTGQVSALSRYLPEEFISQMGRRGSCQIVERLSMNAVLTEQRLGTTGLFDPATVRKMGGLLGADYLVTGSITDLGGEYRVNLRLLDAQTAQITAAPQWTIKGNKRADFLWRSKQ